MVSATSQHYYGRNFISQQQGEGHFLPICPSIVPLGKQTDVRPMTFVVLFNHHLHFNHRFRCNIVELFKSYIAKHGTSDFVVFLRIEFGVLLVHTKAHRENKK
jgi:hypothetical protein